MPASFNGFHIHVANDKSCTIYMNLFGNLKFVHFRTFDTTILRQTNDGHKYANRTRHHNFNLSNIPSNLDISTLKEYF